MKSVDSSYMTKLLESQTMEEARCQLGELHKQLALSLQSKSKELLKEWINAAQQALDSIPVSSGQVGSFARFHLGHLLEDAHSHLFVTDPLEKHAEFSRQ